MVSLCRFKELEETWEISLPTLINKYAGRLVIIDEPNVVNIYDSMSEIEEYLDKKYPKKICGPSWFIEKIPDKLPADSPYRSPLPNSSRFKHKTICDSLTDY